MIHFVIHISNEAELERLPSMRQELETHFPASRLHVFNQILQPIEGAVVCENIKNCGFGWTVRFLRYVLDLADAGDLIIKIDPDTEILGNPIAGLEIPSDHVFGERQSSDCCNLVFYGGFQGFTVGAAKAVVAHGHLFENEIGKQDIALQTLINLFDIPFLTVPRIALWDDGEDPKDNLVWHRMKRVPQPQTCK